MSAPPLSKEVIRRYVLGRQGLWPGRRWAGKDGTAQALRYIECVQMDPLIINGFWLENERMGKDANFAEALTRGLVRLVRFVKAQDLDVSAVRPATLRKHIQANAKEFMRH